MITADFVSVFKALGQPTRLHILRLLSARNLCVCELVEVLQTSQPRISQHLKVLKNAGLVKESIDGSMRIYHLQREALRHYLSSFNDFLTDYDSQDQEIKTYLRHLAEIGDEYRSSRRQS